MKRSFARRLTFSYLFIVLVTLLFAWFFLSPRLEKQFLTALEQSLTAQANLLAESLATPLEKSIDGPTASLEALVLNLSSKVGLRITVIRKDGKVLADSERTVKEVDSMDNHSQRPEVRSALSSMIGTSIRHSDTLDKSMLYVAIPVFKAAKVSPIGVVRVALQTETVDERITAFHKDLLRTGGAALAVALLVALLSVHRISRPLKELVHWTQVIGRGEYNAVPLESEDEFGDVALAFGHMARRIEEKVRELSRERTELTAILRTLVESVLAIDAQGRLLFMNPAAEVLFEIRAADAIGRPFLEVLRYGPLSGLLTEALNRQTSITREIVLHAPSERILSVQAGPVGYADQQTGVLAALHDITELRRLERIRQEFVANASHELRTPLTSIKGYVETLLEGAINDPKHNRAFLEVIQDQSDRLMRLIEDLLDLSAIEAKRVKYQFKATSLFEVADKALQSLQPLAAAKKLVIHNDLSPSIPLVRADREKLTQIFVNLLDNAIKFNRENGEITVEAVGGENEVTVSIRDTGQGIEPKDLPRVFERFFRSDRSHSNETTGTGLGLAIVKHLVENHQGNVAVTSTPGEGSRFCFTLPLAS